MIAGPIACFDGIVWFEPGIDPSEVLGDDNHNVTRPQVGEERAVCIRHDHQEPVGGRMWLLFQSALSVANGFPEPDEELENAALIEVEILSQGRLPEKKTCQWGPYSAQIKCLQVVEIGQITQAFASCPPQHWPETNRPVQMWDTASFTYVHIVKEISQWFVLTRTEPPRLILESCVFGDEPFTVCNCEWDWAKWPHRLYKPRG